MIGIGATLFKRAVIGGQGFSPASLFSNGEKGVWYDPSNLSSMYQSDGVTPAAVNDEVGVIEDQSGNGIHMVQTVGAKCPILRLSGEGHYYLDFDGVDDGMRTTSNLPFGTNSVEEVSVFSASQRNTSGINQNVLELSNNIANQNGAFRLFHTSSNRRRSVHKGTTAVTLQTVAITDTPEKVVFSSLASISAPSHTFRANGALVGSVTSSLGTGTYNDHPLNMGARAAGDGFRLDGRIYGVIVRGAASGDGEIASVEKYLAGKSGVTLL